MYRQTYVSTREIKWFYQEGASALFPDYWEKYVAEIPEAERHDFVSAYYKRLTLDDVNPRDAEIKLRAAKAWSTWELAHLFSTRGSK